MPYNNIIDSGFFIRRSEKDNILGRSTYENQIQVYYVLNPQEMVGR